VLPSVLLAFAVLNFIRIPSPFFADFGNGLLCITDPLKLFVFVFEGISTGNVYVLVLIMLWIADQINLQLEFMCPRRHTKQLTRTVMCLRRHTNQLKFLCPQRQTNQLKKTAVRLRRQTNQLKLVCLQRHSNQLTNDEDSDHDESIHDYGSRSGGVSIRVLVESQCHRSLLWWLAIKVLHARNIDRFLLVQLAL